jgi:hypothetical protein
MRENGMASEIRITFPEYDVIWLYSQGAGPELTLFCSAEVVNLRSAASFYVPTLSYKLQLTRAAPRVWQVGENALGPAIRYHGICGFSC